MKTITFIIVLVISIFKSGVHLDQQSQNNKFSPNKPEIKFKKLIYDFGIINKGDKGECSFIFTNNGETPLILSNVRSSCGCTVPNWPQKPILGGHKDSIIVKYNTKIIGAFNKTITVFSNAENSPLELRIKGNVVKKK